MKDKVVVLIDSGVDIINFEDIVVGGIHFYIKEKYLCCDDRFDDDNGHGSACAHMIRAVAPNAKIYVIKILDDNLEADYNLFEAALDHCLGLEYHIINLSLSMTDGGGMDYKLNDLCDKLRKQGKIIVSSVCNGCQKSYPAAYSSVIGVRGCCFDEMGEYWYNSRNEIQCIADISPFFTSRSINKYFMFSGNSKACALLSGMLLKMEKTNKVVLNFESANAMLEDKATKNDWKEDDIDILMETYSLDRTSLCDEEILKNIYEIACAVMGWDDFTDIGWKDNLFKRRLMHADKMRLLILSLEKRFNITIPDSCLRYDSLSSINKIGKIIEGEINEKTEAYM